MSRLVQSGGVVIRRMNYRESSMIVDILTESHGLVSYIVSGVRQKKPRMSPVLFTPGYIIDLVFYENAPGKLWRIKEASVKVRYEQIPFDIVRGNTALCICELIKKMVHNHNPNEELYEFVVRSMILLDQIKKPGNILIYFLIHFSMHMGFEPKERTDQDCVYFDLRTGWFVPRDPGHPMILDPRSSELLYQLLQTAPIDLSNVKMSRKERQNLTEGLIDYVRYHSDSFTSIRSFDVLKNLW